MEKYKKLCEQVIVALGGSDNIDSVSNCATRLRINYKDKSIINEEGLNNLPCSIGFVSKPSNKQYQIIIGPGVNDAYYEFMDIYNRKRTNIENGNTKNNDNAGKKDIIYVLNKVGLFITPIMMPIVPALLVGGMILAFLNLLVNYFSISLDSGVYLMATALYNAAFSFLPIYVGWQAATQLHIKPILGGMLGAVLLSSNLLQISDVFKISIPHISYSSTILPVLLSVIFMAPIYRFWNKKVPEAISFILVPILTMIIVVPFMLVVIGPIGEAISNAISSIAIFITEKANIIAQPLLAIVYPYMVMMGLDKALYPIEMNLIATTGYNSLSGATGFISNIAVGGATLAIAQHFKNDNEKKNLFQSSGFKALCGVTELAFYGALKPNKITLYGTAIGAFVGGLIAGVVELKAFIVGACPGWLTLLLFVDTNGDVTYMLWAIVVAIATTITSFLATNILLTIQDKKLKTKI